MWMCGRYTLTTLEGFEDFYGIDEHVQLEPRYNIAPTQDIPVIVRQTDRNRILQMMHWGLIPGWSRSRPSNPARLINARSETVASRPSFRDAFAHRRCLVPADGFYEWEELAGRKIPTHFSLQDGSLFAFAGLWESWRSPEESVRSATILTTEPNSLVASLHDRMPVLLTRERFSAWLEPDTPLSVLEALMNPIGAGKMRARRVSSSVNNVREEGPHLLQEERHWRQRGLF